MTKIARIDTFTSAGRYVPRGGVLRDDEIVEGDSMDNVVEADVSEDRVAVEVSALGPTGPNPKNPQQIPPDAEQTTEGYVQAGARLIGEVTLPEKERRVEIVDADDSTQGDVVEAIDEANRRADDERRERETAELRANRNNDDDDLVSGTVADVTANLEGASDAELDRLEAAENDREKPRAGVLNAIERERDARS